MRPIPQKHREQIDSDPYYRTCARQNADCEGRITIDHVFTYAGRQISEMWNYIPVCWRHHLGDLLDKRINEEIAKSRTTEEDRKKYPRLKKIQ